MKIDRTFPLNWSKAKDRLYLYEWGCARRVFRKQGFSSQEADAKRHELHIQAMGRDKSHYDFTNSDFDKVLGAFRAISKPADLISQLEALNGRTKRLIFGIRRTAAKMKVGEAYIAAISERQTGRKSDLEQLNEDELENVRIALCLEFRRAMAAKKKDDSTVLAQNYEVLSA